MAIDGCGVDEPFYFSSAGAADEASVQHDGTDFLINNDTGKTKFGNGSGYQVTIDHATGYVGIGTETPAYGLHRYNTGANAIVAAERASGAINLMQATALYAQFGSISAHPTRIMVNSAYKVSVDTSGNVMIPAAYTTVISGVNTDLYIDSTGLIGPNPSSIRFKENIREPNDVDSNWILQVPIKKYDMKAERGGEKDKIGVIAEEVEPINSKIVRYAVHEITESGPVLLNGSEYDLSEALASIKPGEERDDLPVYRKSLDKEGDDIKIKEWKQLTLLPISVNLTDLIVPLLHRIQILESRIKVLEGG